MPLRTEKYCFIRATLLVALNPIMWERIKQTYRLDEKSVVFVPNWVEEEFFAQHPAPYSPVEGRFNICYIGALTRNRGIDLLSIRAVFCGRATRRFAYISSVRMVPG